MVCGFIANVGRSKLLQRHPPCGERTGNERFAPSIDQKNKDHVGRRRFLGQALNAAGGGMNALQERVKIQASAAADDNFSVQYKFVRGQNTQRGSDFREITRERLASLGLQDDLIALAESQAAEAVPLGLIKPARFARQFFYRLGFSRRIWRLKRKIKFGKALVERLSGNGGGAYRSGFACRSHADLMRRDDMPPPVQEL